MDNLLQKALAAVEDKRGSEPVVLDMKNLTPVCDYFLIASAQSKVQVKAIVDHVQNELEREGAVLLHKEGGREGRWILLDYGWLVVHVMLQEEREFYQIERLWHDAERILDRSRAET